MIVSSEVSGVSIIVLICSIICLFTEVYLSNHSKKEIKVYGLVRAIEAVSLIGTAIGIVYIFLATIC